MRFVSEHEKFLTMQGSEIFIFPRYEEGWVIAVAETVASGLDVILYDIGAYMALDQHLVKVEKDNIPKMARVTIEMIEGHMSKNSTNMHITRIGSVPDWKDVANKELRRITDLAHG
jgi:hypothetical protein